MFAAASVDAFQATVRRVSARSGFGILPALIHTRIVSLLTRMLSRSSERITKRSWSIHTPVKYRLYGRRAIGLDRCGQLLSRHLSGVEIVL